MWNRKRRLDWRAHMPLNPLGRRNELLGPRAQRLCEVDRDSSQRPGATSAPPRRGFFRVLAATLLIGVLAYVPDSGSATYAPPPHDPTLGPFDPAAARKLSPEKRREYDVRFFNEMFVKDDHPTDPRYQLFKKMADEGFEVAHIALRLFDIRLAGDRYHPEAWPRLKALAAEGDASAICLHAKYAYVFEPKLDQRVVFEAVRGAAEAGHPHCSGIYAQYFRTGKFATPSRLQYIAWETKAAKGGDLLAQLIVAGLYAGGEGVDMDLARARCWVEEALRSNQTGLTSSHAQGIRWTIRENAERGMSRPGGYQLGTGCEVRSARDTAPREVSP